MSESDRNNQAFSKSANAKARVLLLAVFFFIIGGTFTWYQAFRSPWNTNVDEQVGQPVLFSHEHHVGQLGIDCRYCHTSVENSSFANIPPTEVCMTCHSQLFTDSPMLQPVRESWATGKPIHWNRVHNLPDFVFFNHSIHIQKGVSCVQCHGRVDQMPLTAQKKTLFMRWCLQCHRNPGPHLRPQAIIFDLKKAEAPISKQEGQELLAHYHVQTSRITDCYTCHR